MNKTIRLVQSRGSSTLTIKHSGMPTMPSENMHKISEEINTVPFQHSNNNLPNYETFQWKCAELMSELVHLKNALRSVGSSGPSICSASILLANIIQLRELYSSNSRWLLSEGGPNRDATSDVQSLVQFQRSFSQIACALDETRKSLCVYKHVFVDMKLLLLLVSLRKRLQEEISIITVQARNEKIVEELHDLRMYLRDLPVSWMERGIEQLTISLRRFRQEGISAIGTAQKFRTSSFLNLTTLATFLSGVTATILQLSSADTHSYMGIATNTFLFVSLVFSIGSAMNSLLVMAWRRSIVRMPESHFPLWICKWLDSAPMLSLLLSGAFFSVAMCLFSFASNQHIVTSVFTAACALIYVIFLAIAAIAFIAEKRELRHYSYPICPDLTFGLSVSIIEHVSQSVRPSRSRSSTGLKRHTPDLEAGIDSLDKCARSEDDSDWPADWVPYSYVQKAANLDEEILMDQSFLFKIDCVGTPPAADKSIVSTKATVVNDLQIPTEAKPNPVGIPAVESWHTDFGSGRPTSLHAAREAVHCENYDRQQKSPSNTNGADDTERAAGFLVHSRVKSSHNPREEGNQQSDTVSDSDDDDDEPPLLEPCTGTESAFHVESIEPPYSDWEANRIRDRYEQCLGHLLALIDELNMKLERTVYSDPQSRLGMLEHVAEIKNIRAELRSVGVPDTHSQNGRSPNHESESRSARKKLHRGDTPTRNPGLVSDVFDAASFLPRYMVTDYKAQGVTLPTRIVSTKDPLLSKDREHKGNE